MFEKKEKSGYRNDEKQNSVEEVTGLSDSIAQQQKSTLSSLL